MPDWTKEQQNAIYARNRNILVSAAAGSGKTAVLVERVIKMVTDKNNPVDIDKLLIVTFTNPAAAEMRFRITKSLNELIRKYPDEKFYRHQLSLLPSAKISTIDAFCSNLVKEHFYELSISQDFSIFDESQLELLENSVISDVLDKLFEENDNDFISLFQLFTVPGNEKPFIDAVKRLLRFIYAQPFPYKWLDDCVELYNPDIPFKETVWYDYIINEANYLFDYALSLAKENLEIIECDDEKLLSKFKDVINDDITEITRYQKAVNSSWDNVVNQREVKFKTSPKTTTLAPDIAAKFKANRELYKSIMSKDIASFFVSGEDDYHQDMKIAYRQLKMLVKIIKTVDCCLLEQKKEINTYSFSDIEHFAINLLFSLDENGKVNKTQLASDLSDSYYEILVDEYQDTNEAQDLLFTYLSNGKNLFTVGDIKQSIYRFRLAMPHIFNKKKKTYSYYDAYDNSQSSKIILDRNFRSRSAICSYVNFIFSNLMSERVGELDYTSDEYLNYGAKYPDTEIPSAQLKILNGVKGEDYDKLEAAYIAKTILNKVKNGELIKDGDSLRPVKFGDFAILMRKISGHINTYSQVLLDHGIPVICDNSSNLFDTTEIKLLLSLIRVIDNPMQDIPLLAAMMSPIYGFTADELAEIRIENSCKSLYFSVSNSKSERAINFINDLKELRSISVSMSVASFIRYLIEAKGIIAYINAYGNGEQRYRNILKFIGYAARFDSGINVGLTAFVRYIDKIADLDKGIESAKINAVNNDCVKIMSVHHSKGLEFPICIFAGTTKQYNKQDLSERLLLNTSLGLGIKNHNEEQLYQYNTIPYTVIKNKNTAEIMSENLRVLYVAMTRAKEQFISFITVDNIESKVNKLASNIHNSTIEPYICKKAVCDGDLLLMCALMHKGSKELRDLTSADIKIINADFDLSIEISNEIQLNSQEESFDFVPYDEDIIKQIDSKLSYTYPGTELSALGAKLTASALDSIDNSFEFLTSSKPSFLNKNGLTPAQRGTAMHTFMQYCVYENAHNCLSDEINRLLALGLITQEQALSLDTSALSEFFNSDIYSLIKSADTVYREFKVSSFVSSKEIYNTDADEQILIQGIADCVIKKNNQLILIDFKTDSIKNEDDLLEKYRKQLMFYKYAVEKTLNLPVVSAALYSFKLGKCCYYK